MTTTVLAADVGGTKTLLALYALTEKGLRLQRQHRYASREWPCFDQVLTDFLQQADPGGTSTRLAGACFAVAGPVRQGHVRLTNLGWIMDQRQLAQFLGTSAVEVVNDVAVLVHGLPHVQPAMALELQAGEPQPDGTVALLALGTGTGMAIGIPTPTGLWCCPSEGGHQEFSPCNTREWQLKQWLLADLDLERLSVERVASGTGLGHVGRWLLDSHPASHPLKAHLSHTTTDLPERIAALAAEGDALCQTALDLWTEACGTAAANLLLTSLCTGGLWLTGGVVVKQLSQFRSPRFLRRLHQVGRLQSLAAEVPVHALVAPETGLFAAAHRARQLVRQPATAQGGRPWGNMEPTFATIPTPVVSDNTCERCVITVPATTANIGPGFDCLGAALQLNNRFSLRRLTGQEERFDLVVDGPYGAHLRGGKDNLFYRAARCAWDAAGHPPIPLEARISLSAPPARGLGSSACAIVAGLCGANMMIGEPLSREKLLELAIAVEGHPDNVVPSLLGGLCLTSRITSQRWRVVPCAWHERVRAVVAIPDLRLSTVDARRALPRSVSLQDAVSNLSALTVLLSGLRSGNDALITDGLHDTLHEPYRWPLVPHGPHVRQAALSAGAWGAVISGSGPAVLALSSREAEVNVGQAMVQAWHNQEVEAQYHAVGLQHFGAVCKVVD